VADKSLFRIEPLGPYHDRAAFSCGVEALDRYLKMQAGQDGRRGAASCFVALSEQDEIAGFYTLAMTSIALMDVPDDMAKKLPRYPKIPATLLGRVAVDLRFRGQQLGPRLIFDAMVQMIASKIASAMLVVEAKDEKAADFYLKFGFIRLRPGRLQFFMPLHEVKALVGNTG
jgi:predicted GNAT family N-acyltransferase